MLKSPPMEGPLKPFFWLAPRSSWEASEEWTLAILLCRRHQLPLSDVYPEQCAVDNQWLHFTCFVQAHQYPKQQVQCRTFTSLKALSHP